MDAQEYQDVLVTMPYKSKYLMTKPERRFYYTLLKTFASRGEDVLVMVKPSLKEFVLVPDYEKDDVAKRAWREISQKHVDFLLCNTKGYPVAAIEYDGSTHDITKAENEVTIRNDRFKDLLFDKLSVPLVRVPYSNWTPDSLGAFLEKTPLNGDICRISR